MGKADFLEALICGFLVALTAALFVEYFGVADIGKFIGVFAVGLMIVDFGILLLIAWPFRFSGVLVFFVITMILGYAAYGPYATYLRGPMGNIGESLSELPEMAEKQMHCLMLIFTNPMAYQQECVIRDQPLAPGEKPEDYGLEITNFETNFGLQQKGEIYAGMPIQIWMTLENKGSYDATNVSIKTTGGKYDVCENLDVLNITGITGNYSDNIRKETDHYFSLTGSVNDPWTEECTYAKNKMLIGGTIKTTYSYDYQTESYLEIEAIKNINESKSKFKVNSAKEKAAPANTLMYTFVPLIWKGAGAGFKEGIIPISFKNERRGGKVTFRGKYEYNWFTGTLKSIEEELVGWTPLGDYKYQYCVNKTNISQKLDECEKDGEEKNIIINNESTCVECKGEPIYRKYGKKDRSETEYDKIAIKPVGDVRDYIKLSCNKKSSEEGKIGSCTCANNLCEIKYVGEKSDLEIKPNNEELLYGGLTVSLTGWPDEDTLDLNFGIKADATYRVEMEKKDNLKIKTPHYTD